MIGIGLTPFASRVGSGGSTPPSTLLTDLQASWSLNGNANDNTGGHNGTATNVTWAAGKFGDGGVFDGSTSFINTSDIPEINSVTQFSMSFWVKFNTVAGTNDLVSKWYYPTTSSWVIRTSGSKIEFAIASSVSSTYNHGVSTASASITTGVWTNVICVFDGTQTGNTNRAKIYINGTNATSTSFGTIPANTTAGTHPVCLAIFPNAANRLNGMLDEVNIWSKVLTPTEITDLQTKFYPFA